jgi:DNA modification methylase
MTKSHRYFYDYKAVKKLGSLDTHARYARGRSKNHKWADGGPGNQTIAKSYDHMVSLPASYKGSVPGRKNGPGQDRRSKNDRKPGVNPKAEQSPKGCKQNPSFTEACKGMVEFRMRRNSDWFFESWQGLLCDDDGDPLAMVVNTFSFRGAHFATFGPNVVKPCLFAGCPPGGTVLDPFFGSATVGVVAHKFDRKFVGIELSEEYLKDIAIPRIKKEQRQRKLWI